jgi:hypothetical protein
MQLDNGRPDVAGVPFPQAWPSTAAYQEPTEADVVQQLAETPDPPRPGSVAR